MSDFDISRLPSNLLPSLPIEKDRVFAYCQNSELFLWVKPLTTYKFAFAVLLFATVLHVFISTGWITYISGPLISLYAILLLPFKALLHQGIASANNPLVRFIFSLTPWINVMLALFGIYMAFKLTNRTTRIGVTDKGLYWIANIARYDLTRQKDEPTTYFYHFHLPWNEIERISLIRPQGKQSSEDYMVLVESTAKSIGNLRIRLKDLYLPGERERFLNTLKTLAPDGVIDMESMESVQPPAPNETFTEIWLKELSAAPRRERFRPLLAGTHLKNNQYTISNKLGMGGQATVYLATAANATEREVAIKEVILPIFPDQNRRKRSAANFENEARILSRLAHPRIVRLLDVFVEDHRAYLVLERASGMTLKQLVEREGPQDEALVITLAIQMCDILQYLHGQDPPMIHRDFTPDNLMIDASNSLKLIDFSVAQEVKNNITGTIVGKHSYIAPEQFRGKPTTQSDVYSLGCVLHFLLTGRDPEAIDTSHPKQIAPAVSDNMDALVSRATALAEGERFLSIEEMVECLKSMDGERVVLDLKQKTT